jgi:hypothetical protein
LVPSVRISTSWSIPHEIINLKQIKNMSLLNIAFFYKDNVEIKRLFTNCGWICNNETIISGIILTLSNHESFDWDSVEAYGKQFTVDEILKYNVYK